MRNLVATVSGAVAGVAYVAIVGLLSVQIIGLEAGAVLDLSNTVVGITDPQVPIWPLLAIVVLSALVVLGLVVVRGVVSQRAGKLLTAGLALGIAALVVWAFALTFGRGSGADQTVGVLHGWPGWVEKGGLNSATHLTLFLVIASLWLPARVHTPSPEEGVVPAERSEMEGGTTPQAPQS